jgi:predicted MPP superfamily phosphohydrolase
VETGHLRQLIISATFLVAFGAHVFVVAWLLSVLPAIGRKRRLILAGSLLLFLIAPLGRLLGFLDWKALAPSLSAVGTTEWMTVMLASLPLALVVAARRVVVPHLFRRAATGEATTGAEAPPAGLTRRVAIERMAGLTAFGVSGATLGWGAVVGRHRFRIEEVVVRIDGLPAALDGYTIAQLSDIHAGLFVGERELEEGFAKVRDVRADLVVVTGDIVDFDARYAPWVARRLADIRGRDGIVAILGNHDYYAGYELVVDAVRAAGVDMLVNEGRMIRPRDGGGFALLGVDDLWAHRSGGVGPDLDLALGAVRPDAPRVLLAHQPPYVDVARGKVALQLSGHTHGGQVNPGFCPAEWFMRYVSGRYEEAGTTLWVNRGFGVAGPPSRVGAPPEVTKVVLVSA